MKAKIRAVVISNTSIRLSVFLQDVEIIREHPDASLPSAYFFRDTMPDSRLGRVPQRPLNEEPLRIAEAGFFTGRMPFLLPN